jgi:hypothetical protein
MSSAPFAVMTGGAFKTWTATDAALLGAGFGSDVVDATFADALIADALDQRSMARSSAMYSAVGSSVRAWAYLRCRPGWRDRRGAGMRL